MQTIIDGIYKDGKVILGPPPPKGVKAKVKVIFEEEAPKKSSRADLYGSLRGKIWISPDFDDPLEDLADYM